MYSLFTSPTHLHFVLKFTLHTYHHMYKAWKTRTTWKWNMAMWLPSRILKLASVILACGYKNALHYTDDWSAAQVFATPIWPALPCMLTPPHHGLCPLQHFFFFFLGGGGEGRIALQMSAKPKLEKFPLHCGFSRQPYPVPVVGHWQNLRCACLPDVSEMVGELAAWLHLAVGTTVQQGIPAWLVGVLSPVNHKGLYQDWKQTLNSSLNYTAHKSFTTNHDISTAWLKYFATHTHFYWTTIFLYHSIKTFLHFNTLHTPFVSKLFQAVHVLVVSQSQMQWKTFS